ncbi:MAG: SRPBCC domain-containing protein [Bacteroidota bacterium]|nr:SRPBCC domain-containing protein [Bacteroidota bacterium]
MNAEPVIVEKTYNAPIQKVWDALTQKDQMRQWYFELEEFKPEVGFEFRFYGGTKDRQYLHICKITEVIPGKKLAHSWRYDGHPGDSFVTFELFADGDKTRLKLTHTGLETFPSEPDFARSNFNEGWNYLIGKALPEYLEKK